MHPHPRRLDRVAATTATDDPDGQRDNQRTAEHQRHPVVLRGAFQSGEATGPVQRRYREHAGQDMRRRPQQDRRDIDRIETQRRFR